MARESGSSSSYVDRNTVKAMEMTRAENAKRRLFADNLLQYSAVMFQQWSLPTITNITEMRLEFLEKDQMNRIVE